VTAVRPQNLGSLLEFLNESTDGPASVSNRSSDGEPFWSLAARSEAADNTRPQEQDLGYADIIKHFGIMVAGRVLSITGRVNVWLQLN
jgi:hypothetical protein